MYCVRYVQCDVSFPLLDLQGSAQLDDAAGSGYGRTGGWHSTVSEFCRTLIRSCSEHGMEATGFGPGIYRGFGSQALATGKAEQILELVDHNTSGHIRLSGLAPLHMMRGARESRAGINPALGAPPHSTQPLCWTRSIPFETRWDRQI